MAKHFVFKETDHVILNCSQKLTRASYIWYEKFYTQSRNQKAAQKVHINTSRLWKFLGIGKKSVLACRKLSF